MVKETKKAGKKLFSCESCGMFYASKSIADKCEKWCKKHGSCNLSIIRHAVKV